MVKRTILIATVLTVALMSVVGAAGGGACAASPPPTWRATPAAWRAAQESSPLMSVT